MEIPNTVPVKLPPSTQRAIIDCPRHLIFSRNQLKKILSILIVLVGLVLLGPGLVGDRFRANKRHGQGFYSEEPEEFQTRYKRFAPNGNVAFNIFLG